MEPEPEPELEVETILKILYNHACSTMVLQYFKKNMMYEVHDCAARNANWDPGHTSIDSSWVLVQ